jgi:hypothetical protein
VGGFINFMTSKSGLVAAVVVLIGLAVAVQGLARPWLTDRRDARSKRPHLVISTLQLSELKPYSPSRELRFTIGNAGGGEGLMTSLRLRVLDHGRSEEPRQTVTAAPIDVYEHRVELKIDKVVYDIRARAFGPAAAPLKYAEGSVDAFVVTLVAKEPQWYRVRVEASWYDVKVPTDSHECGSDEVIADFPPSISSSAPPLP